MNAVITTYVPANAPSAPEIFAEYRLLLQTRQVVPCFDGTILVDFLGPPDYDRFVNALHDLADAFPKQFFFAAYLPWPGVLPSVRRD